MTAVALKKIGYDASDVSVGWCWIDLEAKDRVLWMLLTGKLWEMLAYVLLPLLYLLVRKHINRAVGTCCAGPWGTELVTGQRDWAGLASSTVQNCECAPSLSLGTPPLVAEKAGAQDLPHALGS